MCSSMVRALTTSLRIEGLWDGNNPIHRDEFDQYFYRGSDDDELDGAINSVEEGNILMDNHSLIAIDS